MKFLKEYLENYKNNKEITLNLERILIHKMNNKN